MFILFKDELPASPTGWGALRGQGRHSIYSTYRHLTYIPYIRWTLLLSASSPKREWLPLFCSLLYPQHLEQRLVHKTCSKSFLF